MRKGLLYVTRWLIGIMFLLMGVRNVVKFPVPAVLAMLFAVVIVPTSEKLISKKLKISEKPLLRLAAAGIIFFLYGLSLPKVPATQQVQASPSPVLTASASATPNVTPTATTSSTTTLYSVTKVVDGDTLKVKIEGVEQTVRVVGINTPEVVDPRRPVQCFGEQASARAKQILTGQSVSLEPDATQQDRDKYGRLLRFVFLPDGTDFGMQMIREGYAQETLYSDVPHKYRQLYLDAEAKAKAEKLGLWADDACLTATPTP
jgi:micrococcal nuclease